MTEQKTDRYVVHEIGDGTSRERNRWYVLDTALGYATTLTTRADARRIAQRMNTEVREGRR